MHKLAWKIKKKGWNTETTAYLSRNYKLSTQQINITRATIIPIVGSEISHIALL